MVKKQSSSLGKTIADEHEASDVEMDSRFWHDVFDSYFVRGKESRAKQDDDLLFFVRKPSSYKDQMSDNREGASPYFVRRWAPELDKLLRDVSDDVDWTQSFYLNLIAHTSFSVTVAICSHQVLRNHSARQDTSLSPIYKEIETKPAYPDICFAVDDFDSTFDAVVLSSTDHCYCVLLNAHDGAAFPSPREQNDCNSSSNSPLQVDTGSGNSLSSKTCNNVPAGKSHFSSLWSPASPGKTEKLCMKGPGGRGEVEVSVAGVVDQSNEDAGPFSPVTVSKRGFGVGRNLPQRGGCSKCGSKTCICSHIY